ncbi:hypothetical protein [Pseudonocardia sp. GCM10023141]|uniref:hypothetical protein n=1 Tax=Pseudonocardia sp. GCM10023141 TaxID=3252653 RepID=UPI00361DF7DE
MPVLELRCPDCGHEFRSLVMDGTKVPEVWVCSACGSRRAHPFHVIEATEHPWSGGRSCGCCG